MVVSRQDGQVVGVADSAPVDMTLPGPIVTPVAAVLGVSVRPTHRRQGRLRAMMRHQLDDLHARGEHTAVLTASESRIYQRFGYGPATLASSYHFEKRDLRVLGAEQTGRLRLVSSKEAHDLFPPVLSAHQSKNPGEISRTGFGWLASTGQLNGTEPDANYYVAYEGEGGISGYAIYQVVVNDSSPAHRELRLTELCALDRTSYLCLWDYLMEIDLVEDLRTSLRPIDEPIRWALSDYRRMSTRWSGEHTYVRLVDVGRALEARGYERPGALTFSLSDRFCPWNEGCYRVQVGGDGAVEVVRDETLTADLSFDAATLGSLYLGGLRAGALAEVGLIDVMRPEALEEAERLFASPRPPFCTTQF